MLSSVSKIMYLTSSLNPTRSGRGSRSPMHISSRLCIRRYVDSSTSTLPMSSIATSNQETFSSTPIVNSKFAILGLRVDTLRAAAPLLLQAIRDSWRNMLPQDGTEPQKSCWALPIMYVKMSYAKVYSYSQASRPLPSTYGRLDVYWPNFWAVSLYSRAESENCFLFSFDNWLWN